MTASTIMQKFYQNGINRVSEVPKNLIFLGKLFQSYRQLDLRGTCMDSLNAFKRGTRTRA